MVALVERQFESGSQQVSTYPLTQVLISWDFHTDVVDDREHDSELERVILMRAFALANPRLAQSSRKWEGFKMEPLKARYDQDEDYINTILPVMLLEVKQSMYRAKEMDMDDACGDIVHQIDARAKDDAFQLTLTRPPLGRAMYSQGDLCIVYLDAPEDDSVHLKDSFEKRVRQALNLPDPEKEIVDLVRDEQVTEEDTGPQKTATVDSEGNKMKAPSPLIDNPHHALAIVESVSRDTLTLRLIVADNAFTKGDFLNESDDAEDAESAASTTASPGQEANSQRAENRAVRRRMLIEFMFQREAYRMRSIADGLASATTWYIAKVMSLVTVYREFQALMSFPDMPLRNHLMMTDAPNAPKKQRKRNSRRQMEPERLDIPDTLESTLQNMYNESQMGALKECLKAEGITCIQGPPGTGKTTTIMGILSVILNATMKAKKIPDVVAKVARRDTDTTVSLDPAARANMVRVAAPWLFDTQYKPWYDTQKCELEELEDPTPIPNCFADKQFLDLLRLEDDVAPKRVLVCGPSNAAIDEITRRLVYDPNLGGGIFDGDGKRFNPQVLRMGPNCHPDLKSHTIKSRIASRLEASATSVQQSEESIALALLEEAKVVCATLSVAGSKELTSFVGGFDTVVVDEASQGVELAMLIPLKLNCRRLVLVGDPRQLPATVFSKVALDLKYDQSLFQRLERAGHKINMLSVQYRMHPQISKFPSMMFYEGNLLDWDGVEKAAKPPIPYYTIPIFKPVVFFSLESSDAVENTSRVNREEIEFICQMLDLLRSLFNCVDHYKDKWMSRIAVISPYAEQVKVCGKQIKALFGVKDKDPCPIDCNTVDGFQGREKDLVIFSAVRAQVTDPNKAKKKASVGFLADRRRMNVALTRARLNMWVVGNGPYLANNPEWGKFWEFAGQNQCVFNVTYARKGKDMFLKQWLFDYTQRQPACRDIFESSAPSFLQQLERDVIMLQSVDRQLEFERQQEEKEARLDMKDALLAQHKTNAAVA